MKTLDWARLSADERAAALARPPSNSSEERIAAVQRILAQVRADGDTALRALTRRFDNVERDALEATTAEFDAAEAEVRAQVARLPREAIATKALDFARLIVVPTLDEAFALSNAYGPEHLIVQLREPRDWLAKITCAGSIFLGDYAPESLGDYCSGTNHVLPTGGAARAWSGVSVASFQRSISVQQVSREGLRAIGPCAVTMARAESLEAHAQAVVQRLEASA